MFKFLYILLSFLIFLFSCSRITDPLYTNQGIDKSIAGYWVNSTDNSESDLSSSYRNGYKISEDGSVFSLGVEWSTGKLSVIGAFPYKILFAQGGNIGLELQPNGLNQDGVHTGKFVVKNDMIEFLADGESYFPLAQGKFFRSGEGSVIAGSIQTEFSVDINTNSFSNAQVSKMPSAYAEFSEQDNKFYISSRSEDDELINISLENFSGIGKYQFEKASMNSLEYADLSSDCCIFVVSSVMDSTRYGELEVTSYSDINKRIEGNFHIKVDYLEFQGGQFNIPIY